MSPLAITLAVIKALILRAVSHGARAAELLVATALSVCTGMAFPDTRARYGSSCQSW